MQWNKLIVGGLHLAAGSLITHGVIHAQTAEWLGGLLPAMIGYLAHNPPPDEIKQDVGNALGRSLKLLLLLALPALLLTAGCATSHKSDLTQHPVRDYVVVTPAGTVIAPSNVTVVPSTNAARFSIGGFLFGYRPYTVVFHRDEPKDYYAGGGRFLLADPAFAALASSHTNQTLLGGQSTFSVGSATITVSTNGISAVGTAGSQLINSIGNAVGSAAGSAAKTAVAVP